MEDVQMKKRFIVISLLLVIIGVVLVGCGISQEDYDALTTENENLRKDLETSNQELEALKQEYENMESKYQELMNEKAERASKEMEQATARALAVTYFGDDCLVLTGGGEYLQIVPQESYTASLEGVQAIYKQLLSFSVGLAVYIDNVNYERIGIKFQQDGGKELIEFVLKREDDSYILESITGNLEVAGILSTALTMIANN